MEDILTYEDYCSSEFAASVNALKLQKSFLKLLSGKKRADPAKGTEANKKLFKVEVAREGIIKDRKGYNRSGGFSGSNSIAGKAEEALERLRRKGATSVQVFFSLKGRGTGSSWTNGEFISLSDKSGISRTLSYAQRHDLEITSIKGYKSL